MGVTPGDVYAARQRLRGVVRRTPLVRASALGDDILLQLECWQRTGSFKVRGATNAVALLSAGQRARGLVTASAGNHGQAVALAARELNARATIFVPSDAPQVKRDRIRRLGAELRTDAGDYDEAERIALAHAERTGAVFVHAFSDAAVMAGQGTVALDILDELPGVREVIVPVGGGGLIVGIGTVLRAIDPNIRITGVQSTRTRAMYEAFAAGRVVDVAIPPTLADGLAGCTDSATFEQARAVVDDIVLVEEDEIAAAIRHLYMFEGVVAEGAGAVGVAAVLAGRVQPRTPAVIVVSGGNIDARRLADILTG